MVVNFKEGTPADTKTKNENTLAQLLVGKDAEYQKRVLAVTVQYGLKTNDPLFLVMLAKGQLQVILEDKPKELSGLFDRWSEAIYERLETAKHSLEEQKRISLKGLEIEINKTARTLMQQAQQQEQLRWRTMLPVAGMLLAAIGVGVLLGMAVPVWLQGGYESGKPRSLTFTEVETLNWAKSPDGKLARNIVKWNSESLINLNCTTNQDQQSYIGKVREQGAVSNYCLLRVKPPS